MTAHIVKSTIYIDSIDRASNDSIENFKLKLNTKYKDVRAIEVVEYGMSNSFYNIDGDQFKFYFNDTEARTATLTQAYFDDTEICPELERAMNAVSSGYSCTLDLMTGLITLTNAVSFSITLSTTSLSCAEFLGFSGTTDTSSSTSQVSNVPYDPKYPKYIDIRSDIVANYLDSGLESKADGTINYSDLLYRIHNDTVTFKDNIQQSQKQNDRIIHFSNNIDLSFLDFKLFYHNGRVARPNGWEYWLKLRVHHIQTAQLQQPRLVPLRGFKRHSKLR